MMKNKKGQITNNLVPVVIGIIGLSMLAMLGIVFLSTVGNTFATNGTSTAGGYGNVSAISSSVVQGIVTGASLFGVLLLAGVIGFAIAFFLGGFRTKP